MNMLPHYSTAYGWLTLAGIFVSIFLWSRAAQRDNRLVLIYVAALAGAFLGAKIVYLAAEGWLHWHDAVEIAKRLLNYRDATGDWFAVIAPLGIMLGRVGCILQGCCLGRVCAPSWFTMNDASGVARWPAALVELLFNAFMLGVVLLLHRRKVLPGQLFHIYLMAYGIFRFTHEFLRDTPRIFGPFSGYQIAALGVAMLGAIGFWLRLRHSKRPAYAMSMAATQHS
jgi:phosphatidylglycerol:prolipoprotein diacylglycerol transferase